MILGLQTQITSNNKIRQALSPAAGNGAKVRPAKIIIIAQIYDGKISAAEVIMSNLHVRTIKNNTIHCNTLYACDASQALVLL